MKIDKIMREPIESLNYMERLVNNGSPSGFSFKYTTTQETSPLYVSQYNICTLKQDNGQIHKLGQLPSLFEKKYPHLFFMHPDWKHVPQSIYVSDTDIAVIPTSSSRTVKLLNDDYYIKMCYPGILGRITRELKTQHINSSIDITNILNELLLKKSCPKQLSFFPEKGGKIYKYLDNEIGYVIRDAKPVGKNVENIISLIPAFSLYSKDRLNNDIPIILQILDNHNNKLDFLLEQLLFPIIDCYFYCVLNAGIQPEMHSQNFLIGLDYNLNISSIVFRDLESFDKDMDLIKTINPNTCIKSYPFKCIDSSQYNYKIKHSFMFDHKLGEYFFDQLINTLNNYNIISNPFTLENEIKTYVITKYGQLLTDYFPRDNRWYKFENILIDRDRSYRPYISFYPTKYR